MHKKLLINMSFLALMLFSGLSAAAEMVNINKASAAAIQQNLVGIGPIKAEAIVAYRKKNGKFSSLDDLQNVKGLGPALIKKNKKYLSTSKGVTSGDDKAYSAAKKQAGDSKSASKKKSSADSKSTAKAAKKSDDTTAKAAKKTDKATAKSKSKDSKSKSKTAAKASKSKSAKKDCSAAKQKTMSKAQKKACAKPAKKKKKKSTKKKTSKGTT